MNYPVAPVLPWQQELRHVLRRPEQLAEYLELPLALFSAAAAEEFELRLTRHFAGLMAKGDPDDPLLKQVLASPMELAPSPGYSAEPLAESEHFSPVPGLVHKYHGRVLLLPSSQCAINCRYCFRRHFPYREHQLSRSQWQPALDYIRADGSISEVILSGGDPLSLADKQLAWLSETLAELPQLKRLRVHSRLPVVLPQRVDEDLLGWLNDRRFQTSLVLHINHPNELSAELTAACERLRQNGVRLFNQAVLLKGVNNSAATLAQLSEELFAEHIQPYYLHQLDRVRGAAHFRIADTEAKALYRELRSLLPGYMVPLLTQEIPGEAAKTPLI
ncbi:MAG: EF-P beta-lysylation protein EpmB [Cellvibrionaceae bacterium]|nr:EF-P beta-lysylation protein EpmB [Cellvibrionaceae bacterium]